MCPSTGDKQARQVSIENEGSTWRITAIGGEDTSGPVSLSLNKGDYQCKDGWLTIKSRGVRGFASSGAAFSTTSRSFSLSHGHLLERKKTRGVVFLLIAPIAGSTTLWYRYPVADGTKDNSLMPGTPDQPKSSSGQDGPRIPNR